MHIGDEAWESDPLWLIGTDGTVAEVSDLSVKHDYYLYGPGADPSRAEHKD
jgi:hypothetical protein